MTTIPPPALRHPPCDSHIETLIQHFPAADVAALISARDEVRAIPAERLPDTLPAPAGPYAARRVTPAAKIVRVLGREPVPEDERPTRRYVAPAPVVLVEWNETAIGLLALWALVATLVAVLR